MTRRSAPWKEILTVGCGGDYFCARGLWLLRRLADWLLGGPALRRRRRHPTELRVGDVFDGWRVIGVEPGRRLTLLMEMRAPGSGALEFELDNSAARSDRVAAIPG